MPASWQCTAILHPFSPPPEGETPYVPFFEMCIANIGFVEGEIFSAQLIGTSERTWWYTITPSGTHLSTDQGSSWTAVDMGWSMPGGQWTQNARYFATGPLNWMNAQDVDWWTQPVPNSNAATWTWFNNGGDADGLPFRMMFGAPPPSPVMGDPNQLAFFQNFSFTYFPSFSTGTAPPGTWTPPVIPGFQLGNPDGLQLVVWNDNFGMVTMMTPVNSASSPLPTFVLYHWASDQNYSQLTDRAQNTTMSYQYNPQSPLKTQMALMFGAAPPDVTPPQYSGSSFLYSNNKEGPPACETMPLGQEPPNWARIPAVQGTIWAVANDNPTLCPNQRLALISVLFPPTDEYPQGRYLWTWYSPFPGSDGTQARPVTFMESASTIAEGGTSLALADYYQYEELRLPIPAGFFQIPPCCVGGGSE